MSREVRYETESVYGGQHCIRNCQRRPYAPILFCTHEHCGRQKNAADLHCIGGSCNDFAVHQRNVVLREKNLTGGFYFVYCANVVKWNTKYSKGFRQQRTKAFIF